MQSRFLRSHGEGDAVPRVFLPQRRTAPDDDARPMRALIVTEEGSAHDAVCAYLSNLCEEVYRATVYERGTFSARQQVWDIGILELCEDTFQEIENALRHFQPRVTLFVGSVAALQGAQPGDIVSATKIYAHQQDAPLWKMSPALEQHGRAVASSPDWLHLAQDRVPTSATPHVVFAPLLAGEPHTPFTATRNSSRLHSQDAVAVGEQSVLAALAELPHEALILCGVMPISHNQRSTGYWDAVQHASAFAFATLTHIGAEGSSQPGQHSQSPEHTGPEKAAEEALEVFYSYIDKDKSLAVKLQKQLVMLKRKGLIKEWDAGSILAGGDLDEHTRHLETAHIILLLISSDYLSSQSHYQAEVMRAMERHRSGEAQVIPVLLRPINDWQEAPFGRLQAIPRSGKAVTQFANQDEALREVATEISAIIKRRKQDGK